MLFTILEDCLVVVRNRGVFRQCKVFSRGLNVYAAVGTGFVRLLARGTTTVPTMRWDFITPHVGLAVERLDAQPKMRPDFEMIEGPK